MIDMKAKDYLKQIDTAVELNQEGKIQESIDIFSRILKDIPTDDIKSLGLVGSLFRKANELPKALYCFQKSVEYDPISPRASLGLFHTLWRLESYDKGFDELERFFSISESDNQDHLSLLEDMRKGFFEDHVSKSEEPLSLIKKLREDLRNSLDEDALDE
jgi:tetratricopeptide (TPR) repeat protein